MATMDVTPRDCKWDRIAPDPKSIRTAANPERKRYTLQVSSKQYRLGESCRSRPSGANSSACASRPVVASERLSSGLAAALRRSSSRRDKSSACDKSRGDKPSGSVRLTLHTTEVRAQSEA